MHPRHSTGISIRHRHCISQGRVNFNLRPTRNGQKIILSAKIDLRVRKISLKYNTHTHTHEMLCHAQKFAQLKYTSFYEKMRTFETEYIKSCQELVKFFFATIKRATKFRDSFWTYLLSVFLFRYLSLSISSSHSIPSLI